MEEEMDSERTAIREELSSLSFEELIRLKEQLGTKLYDEAMFGNKTADKKGRMAPSQQAGPSGTFKRVNKNRPREMSSKKRVAPIVSVIPAKKKAETRDPRFDNLCGTFDKKVFQKAYKFVDEIRSSEKVQLKEELKQEPDPERRGKIKLLIQRIENQEREKQKREEREQRDKEEREQRQESLKSGSKPHFPTKAERQTRELVQQFEQLKQSGKLQKHIEKQRKKANHRDRKRKKFIHGVDSD